MRHQFILWIIALFVSSSEALSQTPEIIQLDGKRANYVSVAVSDLDGNVENGKEIVVGTSDARVHAYHQDGTLLWTRDLPSSSCLRATKFDALYSSPAISPLTVGGSPAVIIGYGSMFSRKCDGGVAAIDGATGNVIWIFSIKSFAKTMKYWAFRNAVFSTPSIADADGDGKMEIGFGSFDRNVFLLNYDGTVRWYYHAADTVWSSPAFSDVDNDQKLELVIGTDISKNPNMIPPTKNGGYVYAFEASKKSAKSLSIGFRSSGGTDPSRRNYVWSRFIPQVIYSSPVIANFRPDVSGDEIVVGTGCYFPSSSKNKVGKTFYMLKAGNGKILAKFNVPTCAQTSAAPVDVTGDGVPEVVVSVHGEPQYGGDKKSYVMVFNSETKALLWQTNIPSIAMFQSPIGADLNSDGRDDIIQATKRSIQLLSGSDGSVISSLKPEGTVTSTPAVVDIDGNGSLDLVVSGFKGKIGRIFIWRNIDSSASAQSPVWNHWRGNASRSGSR